MDAQINNEAPGQTAVNIEKRNNAQMADGIPGLISRIPPADAENIMEIVRCFVEAVHPLKIYLFGSFADGTFNDDSDYDFYIVVEDGTNVKEARYTAGMSILMKQRRPTDILMSTKAKFERYGPDEPVYIEGEIYRKGIVLFTREKEMTA